jgi:hypothetical protein
MYVNMESLKTELHCHNIFSNGHVGVLEPIHDCSVTISQQLEPTIFRERDLGTIVKMIF